MYPMEPRYALQHLGLTEDEAWRILKAYNGIKPMPDVQPAHSYASTLMIEAESFEEMMRTAEGEIPADWPETPYIIRDLAEKIRDFDLAQTAALHWYLVGFWDGCRAATGQLG